MLPPSLGFAWVVWRGQREAILGSLAYLALASLASAVLPAYCNPKWASLVAGLLFLGVYMQLVYVLVIFTWANMTDVLARDSCFDPALFRLPCPTVALAIWPMIVGAIVVAMLWLVAAQFIVQPWMPILGERSIPLWWPAALAIAALACIQALLWSPFGLRWLRVLLFGPLFVGLIVSAGFSVESQWSEGWLTAAYAMVALVAWPVAYVGVRRGRCGDVPNWEASSGRCSGLSGDGRAGAAPFKGRHRHKRGSNGV